MIRAGKIAAFFLFDLCDSLDLPRASELLRVPAHAARLPPKPALPAYVRYQVAPLEIDGVALGVDQLEGFQLRVKLYDYGVASLCLRRPFAGTWQELVRVAQMLSSDSELEERGRELCHRIMDRIRVACVTPRERFLSEDYFVFAVSALEEELSADDLVAQDGASIAQLLRAELLPLSEQERDEVLRHRLSYLATDLVVPTWSSALVYDSEPGIEAALEIFEYANSQLLQFRYYDELLDGRLARIYKELETTEQYRRWWPRRYTRAAREVHALFIDVTELTDRTENALKLVGDVFAARMLALAHSRLGVTAWRDSVRNKLKTLDEIYRFAVEQTGMERGELLEIAIVALIVFEIALFFVGVAQ